ncbi:hypothetical protein [Hymenobacter sp. BRD67]|uniref:hypothetical protein n=1 Tax=Hymenobacter sp. BRD67 TaxID=2675877 RepID=UPI0015655272|nr:hypothetical protein [Hymenobacter sp. BRD67]QKG53870.1 hypothetical protein GKZ67_16265 [Hymenobacter sp. BRD67]
MKTSLLSFVAAFTLLVTTAASAAAFPAQGPYRPSPRQRQRLEVARNEQQHRMAQERRLEQRRVAEHARFEATRRHDHGYSYSHR